MNQIISIALIVGGVFLIIYGIRATESISSEISNLFTGKPSDRSIWLLIGGTVALLAGLTGGIMSIRNV